MDSLTIERLPNGGFVVYRRPGFHEMPGAAILPLFACTTIAEALDFIRQRLEKPGD